MPEEIVGHCWNCGQGLTKLDYGRESTCLNCDKPTHCCRNCRHFAPGRPNECMEPLVRHSSVTNRGIEPEADGTVRLAIGTHDSGHGHWLDTGGRTRGFVTVRWLDNPQAPEVDVQVMDGKAIL